MIRSAPATVHRVATISAPMQLSCPARREERNVKKCACVSACVRDERADLEEEQKESCVRHHEKKKPEYNQSMNTEASLVLHVMKEQNKVIELHQRYLMLLNFALRP